MKLGSETGSMINHLKSREVKGEPIPTTGMGATILGWTDRHAATIINWDGKILSVQRDKATRKDSNGMSESQKYTFEPQPDSAVYTFKKDAKGLWREVAKSEKGRWVYTNGNGLRIGERDEYYDYSF